MMRLLAGLFILAGFVAAQVPAPVETPKKAAFVQKQLYPLSTCVVSGEDLGADAVTFTAGGRTFMTCCTKCQAKVEKEPAKFTPKLDAGLVAVQLATYPLDVCVISGKKLGSMGEPVKLVLDGTLVQLCCSGCTKKAEAKAMEMATKVRDAAFAAQSKVYPLSECVVSGEKLDNSAVSMLYGTQLIKLCCDKCAAKFEKNPAEFLAKLKAKAVTPPAAQPSKGDEKKGETMAAGECCGTDAVSPVGKKAEASKAGGCSCCSGAIVQPAKGKEAAKPAGECCEGAAPAPAPMKDAPKKN